MLESASNANAGFIPPLPFAIDNNMSDSIRLPRVPTILRARRELNLHIPTRYRDSSPLVNRQTVQAASGLSSPPEDTLAERLSD